MIVTSADSSHQNSRSNHPMVVASDAAYATLIAIATSSIIPGWRSWISAHAPERKTQPHQKKITEPSTGPTQSMPVKSSW